MNKDNLNPYFQELTVDYLYHLGLDTTMDLAAIFANVKYVLFNQTNDDAAYCANKFAKAWYQIEESDFAFKPIFKTERYHLYKIGPTIIISHGIGIPSLLICLNEITKLMVHLNNLDVIFFKISTTDGVGIDEGNVVITDKVVNPQFKAIHTMIECGVEQQYTTTLNTELMHDVMQFNQKYNQVNLSIGKTLGIVDYYDSQLHLQGALESFYDYAERDAYLQKAYAEGVRSINSELLVFAGFCQHLQIKAGALSNITVDRLISDTTALLSNQYTSSANAVTLLIQYIIYKLQVNRL